MHKPLKRKTFKKYIESKHPEFSYNEFVGLLGLLTGVGTAVNLINKGKEAFRISNNSLDNLSNSDSEIKYHVWTNKENTESKTGSFVKKENNIVYIKLKTGVISEIPVTWLSEKDLQYVMAKEDLNKKTNELSLLKSQLDSEKDASKKVELLKKYKQIEIAYKQAAIKVASLDR